MEQKVVELAGLRVAGFKAGAAHEIPKAWQALAARRAEWPAEQQYGVGWPGMARLDFLAGVELPAGAGLPAGMEAADVPAGRYFHRPYAGDRRQLAAAVMQAYAELAAAGLSPAQPWLFVARYAGDVADPRQAQIACELYVQLA
jgi:predicted transcriptional regulator YdeE